MMKKTWIKILSLAGVFVVIATVLIVLVLQRQGVRRQYSDRATATLPTISFRYEGVEMNELTGYVGVTDEAHYYMRGMLLPLGADRRVFLKLNKQASEPTALRYRVYDEMGERLYEEKTVELNASGGAAIELALNLTNLLPMDRECRLYFYVTLADGREVFYSLRAVYIEDHFLTNFMNLSRDLTDALMDKDSQRYHTYLSFTDENAQNNLNVVTLNSSVRQATWAGLTPKIVSGRTLQLYELSKTQASFSWLYRAETTENEHVIHYDVKEYYSMRNRDGKYFVLDYERNTKEQFADNANCMGTTSILLGIQERDDVSMFKTADNKKVAFTVNQKLQLYNFTNNEMTEIFAFDDGETHLQQRLPKYHIRLLNMSDDGDLDFAVWGYYVSGNHEGSCGLSLYHYTFDNNSVEELLFVPSQGSYEWTMAQCGQVISLNSSGLFYFYFGGNLYALDNDSLEYQLIAENLPFEVQISRDGTMAAWRDYREKQRIHLMNMETNTMKQLGVSDSELEALGFIDHDLVYGIYSRDVVQSETFNNKKLLKELRIVDSELVEQAVYSKNGVYITKAVAEDYSVRISCMRRKATGIWEHLPEDVLTSAEHSEKTASVDLKVASSNMKYNYYYITFSKAISTTHLFGRRGCRFRAEDCRELSMTKFKTVPTYQAYYAGEVLRYGEELSELIASVFDKMGVVLKDRQLIWNRDARSLYVTLTMPKAEAIAEAIQGNTYVEAALEAMRQYALPENTYSISDALHKGRSVLSIMDSLFGDRVVDLSGCTTAQILYYINERHPVLAMTGEDKAVLVCAYNSNSVFLYDPITGEKSSLALAEEADEFFTTGGFLFVSYVD